MIRDPQNISPIEPTYRDPNTDPMADPRYEARKGVDAGTIVGMAIGLVMLLAAGAAWIFAPEKTTTAINLGASLAACERKVLLVDLDPQANATSGVGLNKNEQKSMYPVLVDGMSIKEIIMPTELPDLFASLAADNFYQAIDAARTFSGEAPRAMVMISVARSVFEEKRGKPVKSAGQ